MNIRLRLTLWYTAVFSLILLIFSLAVYAGLTRSLFNTIDRHLQGEASELLGNLTISDEEDDDHEESGREHEEESHEEGEHSETNTQFSPFIPTNSNLRLNYIPENGVYWRILNDDGTALVDPGYFAGVSEAIPTDLTSVSLRNIALADGTPVRLYTVPFEITNQLTGVAQVAESYQSLQEVQQQLIFLLIIGLPLTMLASSAGGWFLATNALAPIDRITRTAQSISAHDLHQRLNLQHPNDEVGRLAATFDQMLDRLETAFEQQRRFIADASHEMKTPLTILKGDIDVALARERTPAYYRHTLERINDTTDRLTTLVREMLILAWSDNQQMLLELSTVELAEILQRLSEDLQAAASQKSITLVCNPTTTVIIEADQDKLHRLFLNLVDNALKYCNAGDSVTITIEATAAEAKVTITDTGPGISPEHLPHLFDRFYRIDSARSRAEINLNSSGAGLGLSIVQWLVQVHNGRIEVSSALNQGTAFTVWLPLRQHGT